MLTHSVASRFSSGNGPH